MNYINKNKLALGVALTLLVMALNQSLAMADDVQNAGVLSVKYDVDYMDEGVHVIIPKMLPETKVNVGGRLAFGQKYYPGKDQNPTRLANSLDNGVASAYKDVNFEVSPIHAFDNGMKYGQYLSFSGNKSELEELNVNYSSNKTKDGVFTWTGRVIGGFIGYKLGGYVGGAPGAAGGAAVGIGSSNKSVAIKNAKYAVFNGYKNLPINADDTVEIYGIQTQDNKYEGNIIFITNKAEVDETVIIRGIIKAQNILAK